MKLETKPPIIDTRTISFRFNGLLVSVSVHFSIRILHGRCFYFLFFSLNDVRCRCCGWCYCLFGRFTFGNVKREKSDLIMKKWQRHQEHAILHSAQMNILIILSPNSRKLSVLPLIYDAFRRRCKLHKSMEMRNDEKKNALIKSFAFYFQICTHIQSGCFFFFG